MLQLHEQQHSVLQLEDVKRVALMITPSCTGEPLDQAREAIAQIRSILQQQDVPMALTKQTVFVRSADDIDTFQKLFQGHYGARVPATSFIIQPPCEGQALAIEAWALGGDDVDVQFPMRDVVTVQYDGLRWIYVAGITSPSTAINAYEEGRYAFDQLAYRLDRAGATFNDVSRVWLYQGNITAEELSAKGERIERYRELNRARAEFFQALESKGQISTLRDGRPFYPASTGIGMMGGGLSVSCLGLQTNRHDVVLQPLENPRQTSAFDYARRFSPKSPLFSRAMAVRIGSHATTWISGTASILDSESVHHGDIEKQTHQTIDNIEGLISETNFRRHDMPGLGAEITDLAKVRVYVKRPEDYEKCRVICEQRFGGLPTIYAIADVCRPELLVEIEGVAFSNVQS